MAVQELESVAGGGARVKAFRPHFLITFAAARDDSLAGTECKDRNRTFLTFPRAICDAV
jgi:hypothetical protein